MMRFHFTVYGSLALICLGCSFAQAAPLDSDAGVVDANRKAESAISDEVRV